MRLAGVGSATAAASRPRAGDGRDGEATGPACRALVAVTPAPRVDRPFVALPRPSAPFLAHLIAAHMQVPQARARRRAEPEVAAAAYGVTRAQPTRAQTVLIARV
jgi:hypothetical protein